LSKKSLIDPRGPGEILLYREEKKFHFFLPFPRLATNSSRKNRKGLQGKKKEATMLQETG